MTESTEASAWDETPAKSYPTEEVDAMVRDLIEFRKDYDEKKKIANEAQKKHSEQQFKVIKTLQDMKKKNWNVGGLGTVSVCNKKLVKVPKDPHNKKRMLEYFLAMDEDTWVDKLGVHSGTLNSFYNAEAEIAEQEGRLYEMPGVDEPTVTSYTRFAPEKKKGK